MSTATMKTGKWYPGVPPGLDGEDDDAYTDRLTGADGTGRSPYDHVRYRECSMGYHLTCSCRSGNTGCHCPCHTDPGPDPAAITPAVAAAAEILCRLYYLPAATGEQVMAEAGALGPDAGKNAIASRLSEVYGSETGDWFATDVKAILRDVRAKADSL